MTRVLIAGAGSYIGGHAARALKQSGFKVSEMDVRTTWKPKTFRGCASVICVAGIVHEHGGDPERYYAVNRDLAIELAQAAREQGVRQFIYLSSMSVYGLNMGHITHETLPAPVTPYGLSKWQAEQELQKLENDDFHVAILRPPMVYGPGCKGNYPKLAALARRTRIFPSIQNERSMLYIGTLSHFLVCLVTSGVGGLYFPQEREYVCTADMVRSIAACHGKRVRLVRGAGWLIDLLLPRVGALGKIFGTLTYDQRMSLDFRDPDAPDFAETIRQTEVDA